MKHTFLALVLAAMPLVNVLIYDTDTCVVQDTVSAQRIKILPQEHAIHLFSQDKNAWTVNEILVQEGQEFHITDGKKFYVLSFDGDKLVESIQGVCK